MTDSKGTRKEVTNTMIARLAQLEGIQADAAILGDLAERVAGLIWIEEQVESLGYVNIKDGGIDGGHSLKASNALLKPLKLATTAGKAVTGAVGVAAHPWLAPFAALILWDELHSRLKVDLQEREANVAWTLWVHRDPKGYVPKARLLALVNAERADYGRGPLSEKELESTVNILRKMRVIGCLAHRPDDWIILETVRVTLGRNG